jgi:hypothetical protein
MMIANLVGFAIGVDGMRYMLKQLIATSQGKSKNAPFDAIMLSSVVSRTRRDSLYGLCL